MKLFKLLDHWVTWGAIWYYLRARVSWTKPKPVEQDWLTGEWKTNPVSYRMEIPQLPEEYFDDGNWEVVGHTDEGFPVYLRTRPLAPWVVYAEPNPFIVDSQGVITT